MIPGDSTAASTLDGVPLTTADFAVLGRVALLSGTAAFPERIDHVLDVIRVGAEADACELFLLDPLGAELLLTGCTGPDVAAFCSMERFDVGRGYPGIVAAGGAVLTTRQLQRDPRYLRRDVQALGYHTFVAVPVRRDGRLIGTLHLAWKRPGPAIERGIRLLEAAAPVLATSLSAALADLAGPSSHPGQRSQEDLTDLAERFRRFSGADVASLVMLGPGGRGVARCASTGQKHIICEKLTSEGPEGCQGSANLKRSVVLRGRRTRWPAPCCTLPRGYARVIGVPLLDDARETGLVFLAWRKAPPGPATRCLAPLLTLGRSVAPELRQEEPASALPSVLPPVTSGGTHPLRLQCLGPFTVYIQEKLLHRRTFVRAKAVDLLKMLILHRGRPISRDALAERLWPGVDLEAGARRLHVAMHALRRAVEPDVEGRRWEHVLTRGDTFMLDLGDNCSVDLDAWEDLLGASYRAQASGRPGSEVIDILDRAVALYQGDLFADDLDAEWCIPERQAYRDQYLTTLVRLAVLTAGVDAVDRSLWLLKRASQVDPLREDVQRRLIEALWRAGRADEARRQYAQCVATLRESVGVGPAEATRKIGALLGG